MTKLSFIGSGQKDISESKSHFSEHFRRQRFPLLCTLPNVLLNCVVIWNAQQMIGTSHVQHRLKTKKTIRPKSLMDQWWRVSGSNRRPHDCQSCALPAELTPHKEPPSSSMEPTTRIELVTSALPWRRSTY